MPRNNLNTGVGTFDISILIDEDQLVQKTQAELDAIESPQEHDQYYNTTIGKAVLYKLGKWLPITRAS